jgi:uncharacterized protein (TIGR00730 family)
MRRMGGAAPTGADKCHPVCLGTEGRMVVLILTDQFLETTVPRNLSCIGVYCASSQGSDAGFADAAASLGRLLASRGIRLVYGGGGVGLMGVLADAVMAGGGSVHGVITRALEEKEVGHSGLTKLQVVTTMHERKAAMAEESDAFIMLPGGFGTLDEFFEVLSWSQLGIHSKPCGILNVNGYFDPLLELLDRAARDGFLRPEHRALVVVDTDPESLVDSLAARDPVIVDKLVARGQP